MSKDISVSFRGSDNRTFASGYFSQDGIPLVGDRVRIKVSTNLGPLGKNQRKTEDQSFRVTDREWDVHYQKVTLWVVPV